MEELLKAGKLSSLVLPFFIMSSMAAAKEAGTELKRSKPDMGRYFVIQQNKRGDLFETIVKRVGTSGAVFTKTEMNCKSKKVRTLGDSDASPDSIKINPTKWYDLVPGSSKSDLFNFLCKKY